MTPTSVGMRCPECSKQKTPVRTIRTMTTEPRVTYFLIAVNVILLLATGQFGVGETASNRVFANLALYGPAISQDHEYWRLITGGFLHAGLLHIAFNMYLLYALGQILEPALGSVRFAILYVTSLLCGSLGALLLQPTAVTVGASGAVFGLMGATFFEMRSRGIDPFQTGIGGLIVLNLVFSFVLSGISIGGHIGGLIGGSLASLAMIEADRRGLRTAGTAAVVLLGVGAAIAGVAVAGHSTGLTG
jgi:membrane associated rhomboid family serine protease